MTLLVGVVLGLVIGGGMVATAFGTLQRKPYATPNLHEGAWEGPDLVGRVSAQRAVWRSIGGHPICAGTNHGPVTCEVGPGTAHVDTCMCGAKRYGVYGAWS